MPAANTRQDFMLGTDTVYTIHWGPCRAAADRGKKIFRRNAARPRSG